MNKKITIHSKVWLVKNNFYAFGSGIARILSAIQATGSIKEAASLLDESYRYTWGRIRKVEQTLGIKLVTTIVGGVGKERTQLTKYGRKVLKPYLSFENDINNYTQRRFKRFTKQIFR